MRRAIAIALTTALVMLLALPGLVAAQDGEPTLPHGFYGTVKIRSTPDGTNEDAPVGMLIIAKMGGVEKGRIKVTEPGKYGGPTLAEGKLLVSPGESLIEFYIGLDRVDQTASFDSGAIDELSLTAYCPAPVTDMDIETVTGAQTDYVANFPGADTTITVDTTGDVTITVTKYLDNPHPEVALPTNMVKKYIDISIDVLGNIDWPMHIELTYTNAEIAGLDELTLKMYYYAGAWHQFEHTGVYPDINRMWADALEKELAGSPVAFGGAAAPPEVRAGGGGLLPPPVITTLSLIGLTATPSLQVDADGIVQSTCRLITTDGKLTLDIVAGTILLDSLGNALTSLSAAPEPSPPAPSVEEVIITAYDLGPDGVTFNSPATLTIEYDPNSLPEDFAEEDLWIAYWDGSKWVPLTTTVDIEANTVACQVSHFTIFAVTGGIIPPAPAAFTVSDLSIQPAEVQPKEAVTITVSVANTGGTEDIYSVVLMINGVKEVEKSVTVAPDSSQDVSFSVTKEEAGSYSVVVDGLGGNFTVVAPPVPAPAPPPAPPPARPINWFLIGGIIAGVIVVIVLITLLVRRRAY